MQSRFLVSSPRCCFLWSLPSSPTSSCSLSPLVHYTAAKWLGCLPQDLYPCIFQDLTIRHYFYHITVFISLVIYLLDIVFFLHLFSVCLPARIVNSVKAGTSLWPIQSPAQFLAHGWPAINLHWMNGWMDWVEGRPVGHGLFTVFSFMMFSLLGMISSHSPPCPYPTYPARPKIRASTSRKSLLFVFATSNIIWLMRVFRR